MRKILQNKRVRKLLLICGAIILLLGSVVGFLVNSLTHKDPPPAEPQYPLTVTFLDVGQGDGIVIQCGETTLMIDGGEASEAGVALDFLKKQKITTIDCYIASHPHMDHIGAAAEIFREMDVKNVMTTKFSDLNVPTTVVYENFLNAIDAEDCEILYAWAGDTFTFGELKLNILTPFVETGDYNNMSIMILMTYGENSFLFTGDAEQEVEIELVEHFGPLHAQVLKVGHHGSSDSSCDAFIAAVNPDIAVISCGKNNEFGHPHRRTLETLEKYGCTICRTDNDGTVTICGDGTEVVVL